MMNTKKNIPDHIKIVIKELVKKSGECHKTYVVYDTRKDGVVCNPRGFMTEDDAIKGCLAWLKRNAGKSKRKAENRRKKMERRAEKAKRRALENSMVMADEELKEVIDNIISQLDTAQNYQKIDISSIYRKYRPILKESIEKEIAAWNSQCVKRGDNYIYRPDYRIDHGELCIYYQKVSRTIYTDNPYKAVKKDDKFVIIDTETGEILDDAQGYGYTTAQKAYKGYGWKRNHTRSVLK